MLDIQPSHLAIIQQILTDYLNEYEVWVFGSRAKKTARPFSDLDLVIMSEQPLPLSLFAQVEMAFSESDLPYRADLLDWATTSAEFRQIIQPQKVLLKPKGTPL